MGRNYKIVKQRKLVETKQFVNWTCEYCDEEVPWTYGPGEYQQDPIGAMTIEFSSHGHNGYTNESTYGIFLCKSCVESKNILEIYEKAAIPHWKK